MGFGPLIDVAVGVLAVMALFSLAATAVQEAIAEYLQYRPRTLEDGIRTLLSSQHLEALEKTLGLKGDKATNKAVDAFFKQPEIASLMTAGRRPSAIPPRRYAEAVLRLLEKDDEIEAAVKGDIEAVGARMQEAVQGISAEAAQAVEAATRSVVGAAEAVRQRKEAAISALEDEFNQTMDRVSGWYGRRTKRSLVIIGFALAAGANVDLLGYAQQTMTEAQLQARAQSYGAMVSALGAEQELPRMQAVNDNTVEQVGADDLGRLVQELRSIGVTVGWTCVPEATPDRRYGVAAPVICPEGEMMELPSPSMLIGWVMIALGVSLGANFWFDLLRRAARLQTSGKLTKAAAGGGSGAQGRT